VANLKLTQILLMAVVLTICGIQVAQSQEQCQVPISITIGNVTVEPCSTVRVNIPIFMNNACDVGGFNLHINTSDSTWLSFTPGDPNAADTIGSRLQGWDMFSANVHAAHPGQVIITAIADMPGGNVGALLSPGDGLICTLHLNYNNFLVCDTNQLLTFGSAQVSDSTGNILYEPLVLNTDYFYVLPGHCHNNPRGDANCSGTLNGLDVVYLVSYFKGSGHGFCCLCSGDANSTGSVNGVDVTYLVSYFKGGPAPGPCR
jgi:hypothetical protein